MAKITLIGMHNYTDGDIWEDVVFPTGFSKDNFINTVLLNYGEMEALYADPDMMKFAITNWANINKWNILKAVTAINIEYEPLHNYDRTETRTSSGTNTGTVTDSVSTNTRTVTDRDETNETEHKVSAYDSSSYSPDNTDDGSNTMDETVTGTGSSSGTRTDNLAHSTSESIRAYGNIGVTTSQQMLQSELDLSLYNIYETFAGIFAFDLLLMVY